MWPVVWPSPDPAEYRLHLGPDSGARVILPVLPTTHRGVAVPPFKTSPPGLREVGSYQGDPPRWEIVEDVIAGSVTVRTSEFGESTLPDGRTTLYTGEALEMTAHDADPADARMHNDVVYRLREDGSEVLLEANGTIQTSATDFEMAVGLRVTLDGAPFFERDWVETIPRRLV
jgi:hypothetical protein